MAKKKNLPDLTLRNLRALKKLVAYIDVRLTDVERVNLTLAGRVARLENKLRDISRDVPFRVGSVR